VVPASLADSQLVRIGQVRGQRLTRAAADAREASEEAAAAAERALVAQRLAEQDLADARAAFVADPACRQARLWLDRTIERSLAAAAEVSNRRARLDLAREAQTEAVRAVARHEIRSDAFTAHRKQIAAADRRRAEDRAEADLPMIIRTTML
jgi:hypothetical protein